MTRDAGYADEETTQYGPGPSDAPVARVRPTLRWTDTRGAHAMALDGPTRVGSAANSELVIDDPTVSRLHAELVPRDDGVWVRDLGSRNGTFVDEVMVHSARVPPNGRVRFGAVTLTVSPDSPPAPMDLSRADHFGPLRGRSVAMRALFARLDRIAASDATVLVQGETGSGKEVVARAIHEASARRSGPFVIVDCGAVPEPLLESELFGHARGAFTGAQQARTGAIEAADGGTLFLDEVGELPLAMQPKLLRALETRSVRRVGETAYRNVDVRILSATHRDLESMVNAGAFREDLYFRLAVLPVRVPPLRERPDDIPLLVESFLPHGAPPLDRALFTELASRPWLGNVRELRNFVERARALGATEALASMQSTRRDHAPNTAFTLPPISIDEPLREVRERCVDAVERQYLQAVLAAHGGSVAEAARAAGLDRTHFHRLLRKHRS